MWEQVARIVKGFLDMLAAYVMGRTVQSIKTDRDGLVATLEAIKEREKLEAEAKSLPDSALDQRLRD
jgi:hypothetical protein